MKTLLIFIFILLSESIFSQVSQEWLARYNNYMDMAVSIATDRHGNVFVTGTSTGFEDDYLTIKYNSSGEQKWSMRYNGPGNFYDTPVQILVDDLGNSYVTGSSRGAGTGIDITTIKYDSNGIQLWCERYNGSFNGDDAASAMSLDHNGNVFITGGSYMNASDLGFITLKYNTLGTLQWTDFSTERSRAIDIKVDHDGNAFITGAYLYGAFGSYDDLFIIKYDVDGNHLWERVYNGTGQDDDIPFGLALDPSGNVFVTGRSIGTDSENDIVTIKYNSNGDDPWVSRYSRNAGSSDVATCLATDNSGNVIVAGNSRGNFITVKYNNLGVQQWDAIYDGPSLNTEGVASIAVDESGNVYVTGGSVGTGQFFDYVTIKYDSSGIQKWLMRYSGDADRNDRSSDLTLDKFGNVFVTGFSINEFINFDFLTIKYSQTTGINSQNNFIPVEFSLSQNYPNPFNPSTVIQYSIPPNVKGQSSDVKLVIYNSIGKEISTLVNEAQTHGSYSVEWNAANTPSGIYFYKLTMGDFSEVKKMTLIK